MAPKAPPPPKEQLDKPDEVLQAVVLADSYNQRFQPLTLDTPRCLLPLANVPLLEWTLESLASAGVKEVIVFCTTKAEKVKAYIESRPPSSLHITTIISTSALSVGDALRVLDSQKVIKSDFILLSGDVVSNLDLEAAVEAHRERRKISKNAIMTLVVKENGLGTRLRPIASSSLFALSPAPENKLLHHEPIGAKPRKKRLNIPGKIFDPKWGEEEIELRNDLIDCGIDVCSVDVLDLFTENFDYQSIRHDFLPGILQSDLLSSTIHVHFAGSGYAARVSDTLSYDAVSRDVLSRRTWPLVPDGNLPGSGMWEGKKEGYELRRMGVYVTRSTVLSRTCTIGPNTLIGSQSHIHSSTSIRSSIIGRNVTIHPSCTITDSYIWDDAVVEEGCTISHAVVGKGVRVGKGSVVGRGCLIGDGVTIGEGARMDEFTRVGRKPYREDGEESDEEDEDDTTDEDEGVDGLTAEQRSTILGTNSLGFIWPEEGHDSDNDSDSDSEEDLLESAPNKRLLQLGRSTSSLCLSDSSGTISVLSQESTPPSSPTQSATSSSAALPTSHLSSLSPAHGAGLTLALEVGDQPGFRSECIATLDHAFEKGGEVDTESIDFAALQIKSARATTNVGPGIVRDVVLGYLVSKVEGVEQGAGKGVVKVKAEELFEQWGPLLSKFAEVEEEKVETLQFLQKHCISTKSLQPYYGAFLSALYNADVVEASDLGGKEREEDVELDSFLPPSSLYIPLHPKKSSNLSSHSTTATDSSLPLLVPLSSEWKALYPPLDVPPTDMPQAWLDALRAVEAAGLIPSPSINPISTLWPDGSRSYGDLSGVSPEICNNGLGCGSPLDTSVAPDGMLGVSQDDGPLGPGVRLYEYFEAQNISATHFYVGSNVVRNYGIFLQARNIPGQHFAVHTWSHQYTTSLTNEQVVAEIGWTMQILADNNFGLIPAHWRPPYGDVDNRVRAIAREVFGLKTITWNPDPQDYFIHVGLKAKQAVKDEYEARVRGPKSPGLIPLEHVTSVEAVDVFIETYPLFLSEGWNVTNIPDLWSEAWYKNSHSGDLSTRLTPGISIVSPRLPDGSFVAVASGGASAAGDLGWGRLLLWSGVLVGAVGAWRGRSGRVGVLVGALAIWGLVSTWKN